MLLVTVKFLQQTKMKEKTNQQKIEKLLGNVKKIDQLIIYIELSQSEIEYGINKQNRCKRNSLSFYFKLSYIPGPNHVNIKPLCAFLCLIKFLQC